MNNNARWWKIYVGLLGPAIITAFAWLATEVVAIKVMVAAMQGEHVVRIQQFDRLLDDVERLREQLRDRR